MKRASALFLCLNLLGCSLGRLVVGDHPFSPLPPSSGHLEKIPEVVILRGQADEVCASPGPRPDHTELEYFVFLRWLPPQELIVTTTTETKTLPPADHFSIIVWAKNPSNGMMGLHLLTLHTNGRDYEVRTWLMDCSQKSSGLLSEP